MSRQRERRLPAEEQKVRASVEPDGGAMTPEERVRFLAEIHEKGKRLQELLDASPNAIVGVDEDGRIQIVNLAAEALFQYRREELLGRIVEVLIPDRFRAQHETDRTRYFPQPYFRSMDDTQELYCRRKDGTEFPADIRLSPLKTPEGLLVLSTIRDISEQRRVEEERGRLLSILEHATDFVGMADIHGNVLYRNKGARKMIGMDTDDDATKHQIWEGHPAWAKAVIENEGIPTAIRDGVWTGETAFVNRDGQEIPVSQVIIAHKAPDGTVEFLSTIARDITESKRVKEELKESEERFRRMFQHSAAGMVLVSPNFYFLHVNDAFCNMLGYTELELLGKTFQDVTLPEDRPVGGELTRRVLSGEMEMFNLEKRYLHKDGTVIWGLVSSTLIRDTQNKPMHFVAQIQDITERKKSQEALRKSEEEYRLVVENIRAVVYVVKLHGNLMQGSVQLVSPYVRNAWGFEPTEFLEDPTLWSRLIHPDDVPAVVQATHKIVTTGRPGLREYRIRHKETGEFHWIEDSMVPQFDDAGNLVAIFGVARDVTERRQLETQLREAQKMETIGRLVGGLAHDFNNLLTVIQGHAALLREKRSLAKSVTQSINEIGKATDSAASLTHKLLAIGGRQFLKPELIEINALIRKTMILLRRLIGENIQLSTSLNPQPCYVKIDSGQIEEVIINLAANARDAMPNGGKLSIQTANIVLDGRHECCKEPGLRKGRYVVLSLTDTGIGIDEESKARIFEPFFTTKKGHGNTGLGLATVFGIVKQSKGCITVSSRKEHGTTFTIYLPRAAKRSRKVSNHEGEKVVPKGTETVLLLEDSLAVRKLLRAFLERQGYLILEASNPTAALKLAMRRKSPIHLLVADIVLPEMSGLQAAAKLAKVHPEIKVVFISGYASNAVRGKQLLSRRRAFLQKPFSMETLARKVREVLDS